MAEQIPYNLASSLIKRLASAAFQEFGRIYGVVDELERLKITVESIRAVLLDAEEKQEQSHAVQNWITRLKDVLYPADDLLDEFFIQEMKHKLDGHRKNKVKEVLHSLSPNQIAFRHKLARQIEKIRKQFNDVVGEMSKLNLNPNVVVVNQTDTVRRETSSFIFESDIIGREDDKKEIISLLEKPHSLEGQNVSLIAIVGIGGLGKTALAQLVYNDVEAQKNFEKKMWVCVSDNFDVKTIVKKMLESLIDNKVDDNLTLENLQNKLRKNLTGKRYLLVLDDIWNESHQKWNQLRTYLMCGAIDSKVLVTTRSKAVAQTMGVSVPYELKGLTLDQSWSLLKKVSFGEYIDTSGVNQSLESVGNEIAEKCKGVPLAIRTLGGLLQSKSKESEWIDVLRGEFWKLCEDEESIMPVLKLSYQNLPPQLRQCFAYCSLYPNDWEIEKDELIQLWMAQSYLECSAENQNMNVVGNQFIETFLMKSFFQDAKMSPSGDIVSFKMHDLMHDLAMQVAGNDCCYLNSETKRSIKTQRLMHVSLERYDIELLDSLDSSRLRTLIFLDDDYDERNLSIISKFKRLRVLKLRLRELNLRLRELNLQNSYNGKMVVLSKKLKHLRCLILRKKFDQINLSKSIGNLVCLQTLILKGIYFEEFSTQDAQDVSKLMNLIHLEIGSVNIPSKEKKTTVVFGKPSLRKGNCWLSSFTNIVQIHLFECRGIQYLPPLERHPFLKSLSLRMLVDLEYIYYEETCLAVEFFQSLESLAFFGCEKLRGWWRMGDDLNNDNNSSHSHHLPLPPFPRLSLLSSNYCPMLTYMPPFPSLDKKLVLVHSSVEILKETINTPFHFPPLSILNSLSIDGSTLDLSQLPKDWVQNLSSLRELEICCFSNQQIQEIEIWFKDNLDRLQNITFDCCKELETLPDWLCNCSSLQHIKVNNCSCFKSLPDWLCNCSSLQHIKVNYCSCFKSLPDDRDPRFINLPIRCFKCLPDHEEGPNIKRKPRDGAKRIIRPQVGGSLGP